MHLFKSYFIQNLIFENNNFPIFYIRDSMLFCPDAFVCDAQGVNNVDNYGLLTI